MGWTTNLGPVLWILGVIDFPLYRFVARTAACAGADLVQRIEVILLEVIILGQSRVDNILFHFSINFSIR